MTVSPTRRVTVGLDAYPARASAGLAGPRRMRPERHFGGAVPCRYVRTFCDIPVPAVVLPEPSFCGALTCGRAPIASGRPRCALLATHNARLAPNRTANVTKARRLPDRGQIADGARSAVVQGAVQMPGSIESLEVLFTSIVELDPRTGGEIGDGS